MVDVISYVKQMVSLFAQLTTRIGKLKLKIIYTVQMRLLWTKTCAQRWKVTLSKNPTLKKWFTVKRDQTTDVQVQFGFNLQIEISDYYTFQSSIVVNFHAWCLQIFMRFDVR